jgi:hypothetical protein
MVKAAGDDRDRLLWTGPKGPKRANLVVRVSYDEGQTFPRERNISTGPAAYSDLTVLKNKTIGVLWERGVERGYQFITFTRFNIEWLESADQTASKWRAAAQPLSPCDGTAAHCARHRRNVLKKGCSICRDRCGAKREALPPMSGCKTNSPKYRRGVSS